MAEQDSAVVGLLVLATPIGNLGDITARAVEALRTVDIVFAEDTRRTRQLLSHLGITSKAVLRLDANCGPARLQGIVERLEAGQSAVFATDAGMPSISDPGAELVKACRQHGVPVTVLPGASAVTVAVAGSGLVQGGFWFAGFLPRKGDKRVELLEQIADFDDSVVLFEAPTRLPQTLADLAHILGDREVCVARELTKQFEEVLVAPASHWAEPEGQRTWRGEITIVVGPKPKSRQEPVADDDLDVLLLHRLASGDSPKTIAEALVPLLRLPRRVIYQRAVRLKGDG